MGDFEHFNMLDINEGLAYFRLGKICRIFNLPENFHLPLGQILDMWTLFAKYEGLDNTGNYHVFTVPTILSKSYQGQLYFDKSNKKLSKIISHSFEFLVDNYSTCFLFILMNSL